MEVLITDTKDYELLATLNKEVQELHYALYPDVFKPYSQEDVISFFKEVLNQNSTKAFVAYSDKEIAGYILLFLKELPENPFQYAQKFLLIDQILICDSYRKKGIGKLLLEKADEVAQEAGLKIIRLNHWTLNNDARNFFGKNGFSYFNEHMHKNI
ncbi:GNAT family N-acetyltransferase [Flavobacterium sp. LaA7.5]|nr:GNAT family N-acetyltransferase [Flavobacterium salilacus subsp. altitudinum]